MIDELDETLRKLLIQEIPVKRNEVDIKFNQPTREWSSRLNKPTINLFLHDVRENTKLRGSEQWLVQRNKDGTVSQKRTPVRVDLHYMVTAWANEPDDEHRLINRVLLTFFRYMNLPADLLSENLASLPTPILVEVAQKNSLEKPSDVWSALDNEMRPAVPLVITMMLDPYEPLVTPLVRTRELRIGRAVEPASQELLQEQPGQSVFWTVGGDIETKRTFDSLALILVEQEQEIPIQEEGRFSIGKLRAGDYTLEVRSNGQILKRQKISVPAPDYTLKV